MPRNGWSATSNKYPWLREEEAPARQATHHLTRLRAHTPRRTCPLRSLSVNMNEIEVYGGMKLYSTCVVPLICGGMLSLKLPYKFSVSAT